MESGSVTSTVRVSYGDSALTVIAQLLVNVDVIVVTRVITVSLPSMTLAMTAVATFPMAVPSMALFTAVLALISIRVLFTVLAGVGLGHVVLLGFLVVLIELTLFSHQRGFDPDVLMLLGKRLGNGEVQKCREGNGCAEEE